MNKEAKNKCLHDFHIIVPQRSVCKQKRHAPLPWVTQGTLPHYSLSSSPTKRPDRFKIQNQRRINETHLLPPKSCPFSPFRFFIYEQSKNYKYFVKGKVTIRNRKSQGTILSKTKTVNTSIFTKFQANKGIGQLYKFERS